MVHALLELLRGGIADTAIDESLDDRGRSCNGDDVPVASPRGDWVVVRRNGVSLGGNNRWNHIIQHGGSW